RPPGIRGRALSGRRSRLSAARDLAALPPHGGERRGRRGTRRDQARAPLPALSAGLRFVPSKSFFLVSLAAPDDAIRRRRGGEAPSPQPPRPRSGPFVSLQASSCAS